MTLSFRRWVSSRRRWCWWLIRTPFGNMTKGSVWRINYRWWRRFIWWHSNTHVCRSQASSGTSGSGGRPEWKRWKLWSLWRETVSGCNSSGRGEGCCWGDSRLLFGNIRSCISRCHLRNFIGGGQSEITILRWTYFLHPIVSVSCWQSSRPHTTLRLQH